MLLMPAVQSLDTGSDPGQAHNPGVIVTTPAVHRLVAEPLTPESFATYGRYAAQPERAPDWGASGSRIDGVKEGRAGIAGAPIAELWNLGDLSYDGDVPYMGFVRYFHIGFRVSELERHTQETQTWIARRGTSFVVVAPPTPSGIPDPSDTRAFLVEPGDVIAIGRGAWMCHFFPIGRVATYTVITARRAPEQDRDLVNFLETADTVLEIVLE